SDNAPVVVQKDGKIVTGGGRFDARGVLGFAVGRFNADGTTDTGFGGNGIASNNVGGYDAAIAGLAVQSDGKIVATGYAFVKTQGSRDGVFAVARYTTAGALDTT